MDSSCKMAACLLVLLIAVQACVALPVTQDADDSLPDILGRLHDVLESIRDYLQEQKADKSNTAEKPEEVKKPEPSNGLEERNEETREPEGLPEISEVDNLDSNMHVRKDTSSAEEDALESASKDVSLRDVLSYLLELERERQSHSKHKAQALRDTDIPFPLTGKDKSTSGK